ncbi:MAG: serine/threonine-protein kinase [Acidobacteriota bacterium]
MPSNSDLTPEATRRWQSLQAIVDQALELPAVAWESHLQTACNGDEELLSDARRLLRAIEQSEDFLERPVAKLLPEAEAGVDSALSRLGAYRLVRRLAGGGMGDVWLAERHDGEFEQVVAIKILSQRFDDEESRARLRAERQILARLEHTHIARLFDGGTAPDGRPFLVMELIEGEPIDRYCATRRLGLDQRLRLVLDLCSAVANAHRHSLVHRDLKPSNVLVTAAGVVKLVASGGSGGASAHGRWPRRVGFRLAASILLAD